MELKKKKKEIQMNLFTRQKQTHRLGEQTCGCQRGKVEDRNGLGIWGLHVSSAIFEIDNQQGPTVK